MRKVLIIKNWDHPDLFRQTPLGEGMWKDIKFTFNSSSPDYVIVLNYSPKKIKVNTYRENIWSIQQEPPTEFFKVFHKANKIYQNVFTTDPDLNDGRYIHSQPALPWLIDKTYDFLKTTSVPEKPYLLSWITSNKSIFQGHKQRMRFLRNIRPRIDFDLFGRGFKYLDDKWDGLSPYRYSIVVESHRGPYYFSEKLTDCYLAWTMPIYFGCTNITDYFPKDSLVQIDIEDPDVVEKVKKTIESNLWITRRKAIEKARELVLNKYQFFPYIYDEIKKWERKHPLKYFKKEQITLLKERMILHRLRFRFKQLLSFPS